MIWTITKNLGAAPEITNVRPNGTISDHSRCFCNDYVSESGGGECKMDYEGSPWCYVNKDSSCNDKKTSISGQPFQWSTEACRRM